MNRKEVGIRKEMELEWATSKTQGYRGKYLTKAYDTLLLIQVTIQKRNVVLAGQVILPIS